MFNETITSEIPLLPESDSSGFTHAFVASLSMIVVSELGDKTFFIAAIMSMNHSRLTVFSGAMSALALMTVLSALFGYAATLIPKVYTTYIATLLFAVFGMKMIYDGCRMSDDEGVEEFNEVQDTLKRSQEDEEAPRIDVEGGEVASNSCLIRTTSRVLRTLFSKIFIQALTMTFLAEWGDRSQIATVVLAAAEDVTGVCLGGILGHGLCTGLAVLGGRMVAQKISVRTVTIVGGFVFILFAISTFVLE